jgi:hypothetical protein
MKAVAISVLAHPAWASAQTASSATSSAPRELDKSDEAKIRESMRTGATEYRKSNLEGARQAFATAWEIMPRPEIAAALADVEMKLGRYRDAAAHWDYYLRSEPTDRADAAARLDECRSHLAAVRLELDPAGAELEVDGAPVPTNGRGETVWLDPGAHTFAARYEGRAPLVKRLELTAGQDVRLDLVLVPASTTPSAVPVAARSPVVPTQASGLPTDSSRNGLKPRTIVVIGGATLTAVAAGLGGWFLLKRADATSAHDQLLREVEQENPQGALTSSACVDGPQRPAKCTALSSKTDELDRHGNWALGSFIGAGVLGAATVVTYMLWPGAEERTEARVPVVAPFSERGAHGVQLRMAF